MTPEPFSTARLIGLIALGALGMACLLVLRPFISALLWAAILAFSTWPVCRFLRDRLRLSPSMAALVMVLTAFLFVGLPIALATPTRREDIESLQGSIERLVTDGLPGLGAWLRTLPLVGEYVDVWLGRFQSDLEGVTSLLRPYAGTIAQNGLAILLVVLSGLGEMLLAILLAFFLYRDGPAIAQRVESALARLGGERGRQLVLLAANVTRGVVWGLVGTAVAQGILAGIGFAIAGVPQPVLLAVVTGAVSIFPVGAPLVWIPATLWLFTQGQTGWGVFMGLYGAFCISGVDNVIRPAMISRGADLPFLLTMLGALGGVFAFGFLGLFLGPVVLAVGYRLLLEFTHDEPEATLPPSTPDSLTPT